MSKKRRRHLIRIIAWFIPAIVCPPVTGNGNELQKELDARQLVKDLCWFPVQPRWTVLDQELHHFHHLLTAVADGLTKASEDKQSSHHSTNEYFSNTICVKYCTFESRLILGVTYPLSPAYLIVRLGVNGGAPLCALQRLLHLLHLDCQMGLKVPT